MNPMGALFGNHLLHVVANAVEVLG